MEYSVSNCFIVVDLCMNIAILYNIFHILKMSVLWSLESNNFKISAKKKNSFSFKIQSGSYSFDIMESE